MAVLDPYLGSSGGGTKVTVWDVLDEHGQKMPGTNITDPYCKFGDFEEMPATVQMFCNDDAKKGPVQCKGIPQVICISPPYEKEGNVSLVVYSNKTTYKLLNDPNRTHCYIYGVESGLNHGDCPMNKDTGLVDGGVKESNVMIIHALRVFEFYAPAPFVKIAPYPPPLWTPEQQMPGPKYNDLGGLTHMWKPSGWKGNFRWIVKGSAATVNGRDLKRVRFVVATRDDTNYAIKGLSIGERDGETLNVKGELTKISFTGLDPDSPFYVNPNAKRAVISDCVDFHFKKDTDFLMTAYLFDASVLYGGALGEPATTYLISKNIGDFTNHKNWPGPNHPLFKDPYKGEVSSGAYVVKAILDCDWCSIDYESCVEPS